MKVAILGIAHLHVTSYTHCFKELGVEIVGAYDCQESQLTKFCQDYDLQPYTDLQELLDQDFDTVLICSENSRHCEYTLEAALKGKHVIVEKPMALSLEESNRMIEACDEANVKLMIAHPVRFSNTMQTLKKQIESGNIGKVLGINATNHGKNPGGWFIKKELSGGGAIIDHTIHMADLIYWFFKPSIESVHTMDAYRNEACEVEDNGLVHIRFKDGSFMSLDTSWNRPDSYPVWGDAGLTLITDKGLVHADGFGRKGTSFVKGRTKFNYFEEDMDMTMIKAFKHAIENDLPSPVPGEAGKFTVKIANMAYESIRINDVVID